MVRVMAESSNCQRLRDELKSIRSQLEKLLEALSTDEAARGEQCAAEAPAADCGQAKLDFFDQITQGDQLPEGDDLYRKVLTIITTKGYASTLVLQHKLELNYRQASSIIADLERDGMVGPAHGFRPHKVLPPAYALRERIERGFEDQNG